MVEGSVLRVGDRVRITAQLIHAATDAHVWAQRYDRPVHDVLTLQSDVAYAIAAAIEIAREAGRVGGVGADSPWIRPRTRPICEGAITGTE